MKLFLHDEKHDQIISELELGQTTPDQEELLEKVFEFFREKGILDRYKEAVMAGSWSYEVDEEDPAAEASIVFHNMGGNYRDQ